MMQSFSEKNKKERGFTIVEVLIALTIFSIAVGGVITVAVQGGLNINASKLSLTANYLADEGVELMRAMRDTSVINATTTTVGWNSFTSAFGATGTRCTDASHGNSPCDINPTISSLVFPSISNVVNCTGSCPLYYLTSGSNQGYYSSVSPGSGTLPSPYSRQIVVTPLGANEVRVTSTVIYLTGSISNTVTVSENLYNWY